MTYKYTEPYAGQPWLGVSSGAEALAADPRMTGQPDVGPMDLGVSDNAGYQVAHGGFLGDIGHQQQNALNFLGKYAGKVGNKLQEILNRPIMAPTITEQEHKRMIRGENTGPNNWDSRY